MSRDTDRGVDGAEGNGADREGSPFPGASRRNLLAATGAGLGLAALGSADRVFGQEDGDDDDDETATPTEAGTDDGETTPGDGGGAGESVFDDLVDPTFGYPLAADETDAVDLEHVVEVTQEDGEGAHPEFPAEPDSEAVGSFVEIPAEFFFDPVGLHVAPGDLVHFRDVQGLHTVTAYTELAEPGLDVPRRVPPDVQPFTSPPLTPGQSWVYEFSEPGVYDYLCLPHLGLGMVGRVVVFDPAEHDLDDETFAAPTGQPLFPNDARVLQAEALDPENVVAEGAVPWSALSIAPPTPTPTPTGTATETEEP